MRCKVFFFYCILNWKIIKILLVYVHTTSFPSSILTCKSIERIFKRSYDFFLSSYSKLWVLSGNSKQTIYYVPGVKLYNLFPCWPFVVMTRYLDNCLPHGIWCICYPFCYIYISSFLNNFLPSFLWYHDYQGWHDKHLFQ